MDNAPLRSQDREVPGAGVPSAVDFLLALALVAAGLSLERGLMLWGDSGISFVFLYPTVVAAAWFAGRAPGLLATALATLGAAWLLSATPAAEPTAANLLALAVFASLGVAFSIAIGPVSALLREAGGAAEPQRVLAETQERLQLAVSAAPIVLLGRDRDLRMTWIYDPRRQGGDQGLIGTRPQDTYRAEEVEALERLYAPVLAGGQTTTGLIRLRDMHSDAPQWFEMFNRPARDGSGAICGIVSAAFDVTELVETRAVLADREAMLRMAVESADMAEWEYFIKESKTRHSESLTRLYGMPPRAATTDAQIFARQMHPEDRATLAARYREAFSSGANLVRTQFRVTRPDGSVRWIASRGQIFRNAHGCSERIVGIDIDTTEEMRILERLRRSNAELEQFAYAASHDLKEPIRTVSSFASLLERHLADALDSTAQEYFGFIYRGARQMESLVNGLLDYATATQAGQERTDVALEAVFADVLEQLESAITEAGSKVTREPLPVVYGNRVMLTHVLQNLLGNALKFRRRDRAARVHVSAIACGTEWIIRVQDNGIGVDSPMHEVVFEAFRRTCRSQGVGGSGLGLTLCKKIIEHHQGRIWVESFTDDEGAVFCFTLPSQPVSPQSESPAAG
jgi:PAS domain S-box-containing protein